MKRLIELAVDWAFFAAFCLPWLLIGLEHARQHNRDVRNGEAA
jgi:hypothetical protein